MRPIRRILVAIKDPTAASLPAVTKGAQLARALGAHLELFHAISTPIYLDAYSPDGSVPYIERHTRHESLEHLEKIASGLRTDGLQVDVSATWDFPIYEAIVRRAERDQTDLVIAERHGKAHVLPALLHLTDWELLRASPVPVLLVKTAAPYRRPVVLAAVDPEHALSKPAALDREILQVAKSISGALHGSLHAVNAYVPFPAQPPARRMLTEAAVRKLVADARHRAQRNFLRVVKPMRIPESQSHLVARHPIEAIGQTARKTRSSLVVMGAVSRSGLKRFIFGNTAESLLDSLNCDMLIVKPPGFAARVGKRIRGARFAAAPYIPYW